MKFKIGDKVRRPKGFSFKRVPNWTPNTIYTVGNVDSYTVYLKEINYHSNPKFLTLVLVTKRLVTETLP